MAYDSVLHANERDVNLACRFYGVDIFFDAVNRNCKADILRAGGNGGGTGGGGTGGTGELTLTATGYKVKGTQRVDLSWADATSSNVDVYRDGSLIVTTGNDGAYTDNLNRKGGGSYTYQICE